MCENDCTVFVSAVPDPAVSLSATVAVFAQGFGIVGGGGTVGEYNDDLLSIVGEYVVASVVFHVLIVAQVKALTFP